MIMAKIDVESPVRYEKKETKIKIETDRLEPKSCKIVEVKESWLKSKKFLVCVNKDSEPKIIPIK